jgi:heat shock protein HslJ
MGVDLTARRSSVYFNVLPPGNGPALANTSISGEPRWTGTLPADGDYIVRVYLMRGAARRNASARFVVAIAMTPVRASASQVPALTSQVPASTSPVPASTSKGLAGTSWQLVKLQSMDDRTITPGGGVYTINFGVDGKAQVRADCNRGQATWRASGAQLEFGPLAMTRAECPRGSLAPRFATDLGFVRSFSIRNGKLYLSLVADAGVYEFAR